MFGVPMCARFELDQGEKQGAHGCALPGAEARIAAPKSDRCTRKLASGFALARSKTKSTRLSGGRHKIGSGEQDQPQLQEKKNNNSNNKIENQSSTRSIKRHAEHKLKRPERSPMGARAVGL